MLNFEVDQALLNANLIEERRAPMFAALNRVKNFFERALADSAVVLPVPLRWEAPNDPPGLALARSGTISAQDLPMRIFSWAVVRDRLQNISDGAGEPFSEVVVYENLPPQSIPFRWESTDTTPRQASQCRLTYALAQQLQFNPAGPLGEETTIRVRPPNANLKWQFWPGQMPAGVVRFDFVVTHEVCHLLGFQSNAETAFAPSDLALLDVYRFADSSLPTGTGDLIAAVRELRPNTDASVVMNLSASFGDGSYPMSRGTRVGGDGRQASHFRDAALLTPPNPIGLMGPSGGDQRPDARVARASVADMTVLDRLGWVLEPTQVNRDIAVNTQPLPTLPVEAAALRTCCPMFQWIDNTPNSASFVINIFPGDPTTDPDPFPQTFYDIQGTTFVLPQSNALRPGPYTWEVVGMVDEFGGYNSSYRHFTILCPADFNGAGGVTVQDIFDFITAWFASDPAADFNGAGGVTIQDMFDFLTAFYEPCP